MSNLQSQLFGLQEIDTQLIHGQARLNKIAKEIQEPQAMADLRATIEEKSEKINQIQAKIKDTELQIGTLQDKYSRSSDLLYSGKVKNPKELEDLQTEIKGLERRNGDLEETLLIQMEALDAVETVERAAKDELMLLSEEHDKVVATLQKEQQTLATALKSLMGTRKKKAAAIDKSVLTKYQKLLKSKGGIGVAKINNNSCQGCHVSIPAGLTRKVQLGGLETCPSCGRIMVVL